MLAGFPLGITHGREPHLTKGFAPKQEKASFPGVHDSSCRRKLSSRLMRTESALEAEHRCRVPHEQRAPPVLLAELGTSAVASSPCVDERSLKAESGRLWRTCFPVALGPAHLA